MEFGFSRFSLSSPTPNFTKNPTAGSRADGMAMTTLTRAFRDHMRTRLETETPNLMLVMLRHEIV